MLAHLLGRPTVIFGTAIAVSVTPDGKTVGVTDSKLARIQKALAQKPDVGTPAATVIVMLRNM